MPKFKYLWPFWVSLLGTILVTLVLVLNVELFSVLRMFFHLDISLILIRYLVLCGISGLLIYQLWANPFQKDYKWILSILLAGFPIYWVLIRSPKVETVWVFGGWAMSLALFYTLRYYRKGYSKKTPQGKSKWIISVVLLTASTLFAFAGNFFVTYHTEIVIGYICLSQLPVLVLFYLHAVDRRNQDFLKKENREEQLIEQIGQ